MNGPDYAFPLTELVSNGQWKWAIEPRLTAKFRGIADRTFSCDRAITASHSSVGVRYGYLDRDGAEVIPTRFEDAQVFENGRAWVQENSIWGLVNASGGFVTPPMYDWVDTSSEGLRAVRMVERLGYVDETGSIAINPRFGYGGGFHEGLAVASPWSAEEDVTPRGVIDTSGAWVIAPKFSALWEFEHGLAPAQLHEDSPWGFINTSGEWAIPPVFDGAFGFDANGIAAAKKGGLWGAINVDGRFVIDPQFDQPFTFIDGIARVNLGSWPDSRMGFIDTSGKYVIPPRFDTVYDFDHGYALVKAAKDDESWQRFSIDRTGQPVSQFHNCDRFSEGLAFARAHNGSVGVIDTFGNWVVDPTLPHLYPMGPFGCGVAVLTSWGADGPHLHHEWVGYITLT